MGWLSSERAYYFGPLGDGFWRYVSICTISKNDSRWNRYFCLSSKVKVIIPKTTRSRHYYSFGGTEKPEISFDCQIPLLSLPYIFGVTLKNLPASVPYIFPDEFNVEYWKRKLQGNHYKIGIFWSGNHYFENNQIVNVRLNTLLILQA